MKEVLIIDKLPKDIAEALIRTDVYQKYEEVIDTLFIASRNKKKEPLTNAEKIRICKYVVQRKHMYCRIAFDGFVTRIDR